MSYVFHFQGVVWCDEVLKISSDGYHRHIIGWDMLIG